ncbi:ankyrin repeat domain-containing protein [Neolewinella lacunae]|uniref:Ankyrin repeat domain-containing protein n=1 Tax=Neolewinella lacunae TaxID=1517758 RepID=A0A923PJM4_9BACT|nr:ankyrin repeat domain-containing protein [Neolewinella lacunae]MBC6994544.1 ankyrin repeat domain-containing protein [Neolewinella lacunae]MDN3634237.1 ankyrin repeat domain-containing protein [Neolewinella lacunae]
MRQGIALTLFVFVLAACDAPAGVDEIGFNEEEYFSLPIIEKIAGYDVAALELRDADLPLARQKMSSSHVLWYAAAYCDTALLRQTILGGGNPNIHFQESFPLSLSAYCDSLALPTIEMLVAAGAVVDTVRPQGFPVFSSVVASDNLPAVRLLLAVGADPERRDLEEYSGCRPIHCAKSPEMLFLFLDQGISLQPVCSNGQTLLHRAAMEDLLPLAEYLLEYNLVNPAALDNDGYSAYDYAEMYGFEEMMERLKQ